MNGMQNDFEYGTGIEPLHHPEKYNGGKGESRIVPLCFLPFIPVKAWNMTG